MATTVDLLPKAGANCKRSRRKVGASTINYAGAFAFINAANGYTTNTTNSGANASAGVCVVQLDNSGGANGELEGEFLVDGMVTMVGMSESLAITDVEKKIYASDNASLTTTSASNTYVGILKDIDDNGDPVLLLDGTNA